ncbi:MAG: tol-pal system protein YbgF [Hyphomicrobiales bacterium]|nr:tol-pal system protein YbgF [Hyphomicrobiales bacterium]
MTIKARTTRPLVLAATLLLTVGMAAPPVAEAAWWPWSKRQERAEKRAQEDAQAVAEMDVTERLARAEAHIRELTGQVEELAFQLHQMQQKLGDEFAPAALENAPAVTGTVQGATAEPLGRLVIDAPPQQPIDLTAPGNGEVVGAVAAEVRDETVVASLGDAGSDYERAYNSILRGDYERAEASFRSFLTTFPDDNRAPDARYWLGESLFARGRFGEAADEFLAGYKAYPQSPKAPDTLLKLGLSLAGLGEREAACQTYAEVLRKYPDSSNALRQRVAAEQAVASC